MATMRWGRTLVVLLGALLVALLTPVGAGAHTAVRASAGQAQTQNDIAKAFAALSDLAAVRRDASFLQGYDLNMRLALQEAGQEFASSTTAVNQSVVSVTSRVGRATVVRSGEATVPFTVTVHEKHPPPPSFSRTFRAVALHIGGHWKVSWTTMCLLVESTGTPCPPTPKGVAAGDILPSVVEGTALTAGLVRPTDLAMAPGGGVFVADDARNQILQWKDGVFNVVAGNGLEGYAGDGGPASGAELSDPGQMAIGPNGTLYFVDSGNHRVRAVSLHGIITTVAGDGTMPTAGADVGDGALATRVPLDPGGLAVGPTGQMWISSDNAIRTVTDGVLGTDVVGSGPYGVTVAAGGTTVNFSPGELALNGQGQLITFSFDTKLLLAIDPDGRVAQVAPDYATALSGSPDGSVLVAQHGPGLAVVHGITESNLIDFTKVTVPGLQFGLAPQGVAEATDGTIYIDTEPGNGYDAQSGLYAISHGKVTPVSVTSSLNATLPAVGASGFAAGLYPATQPSRGAGAVLAACPSGAGVVPFDAAARREVSQLLRGWNSGLSYDLHASDRSWWPDLVDGYATASIGGIQVVGPVRAASHDLFAPPVAAACGAPLLADSVAVVMTSSPYSATVEHLFLLDRGGTPLVYFSGT